MTNDAEKDQLQNELDAALSKGMGPMAARYALACLGAIPFVGGAISGVAGTWSEAEQKHFNKVFAAWLKMQEDEIREIGATIMEVMSRLDLNDQQIRERLESPEYLSIIKKCFRDWSAAESEEKRLLVRNLLVAAASTRICSDDIVRLFVRWIETYSELHFRVLRCIYKNPGCTRFDIWQTVGGERAREDSSDADLFKLMIFDLSTGHLVRQHRATDYHGNYIKQAPKKRVGQSGTLTSAFDDDKPYELTDLGTQFVRYTMEGVMPKLSGASTGPMSEAKMG